MAIEQTLILIKPDGAFRKLTGLTIDRLDATGLEMVGAKMIAVSDKLARDHYSSLSDKPFFEDLIKYIRGGYHGIKDSRILVYRGENAIKAVRLVAGATNPEQATPGTIRGSFGRMNSVTKQFENVIHASSDPTDAAKEVALWFKKDEIIP
jgi:nucleoside-diphosphate kinase